MASAVGSKSGFKAPTGAKSLVVCVSYTPNFLKPKSMYIKSLTASNFEGQSFQHELGPVTYIHGDNFSGKSARVNALVLALTGYIPGVGKRPNDLFERLGSDSPLRVHAVMDETRFFVKRTYTKAEGTVACSVDSTHLPVPAVAVDATEFLSLSEVERTRFLFGVVTLPDNYTATRKWLVAQFKNLKLEYLTAYHEEAVNVLSNLAGHYSSQNVTVQDFVQGILNATHKTKLETDATAKRLQKTFEGMVQIGNRTPPRQDVEREREALTKQLQEAQQQFADLKAQQDNVPGVKEQTKLVREGSTTLSHWSTRIAELNKTIEKLRQDGKCPVCGQVGKIAIRVLMKQLAEFEDAYSTALKATDGAQRKLDKLVELGQKKAEKQMAEAAHRVATLEDNLATVDLDYKLLVAWRASEKAKADTAAELKKYQEHVEVYKVALTLITMLQQWLMVQTLMPVVAMCNKLCAPILRSPLVLNNGCEFGMERDGKFYSWRSFSGSERALTFCAIQIALSVNAPFKLAILDELDRFDDTNKRRLVDLVMRLVSDKEIDQAILVGIQPPFKQDLTKYPWLKTIDATWCKLS